MGWGGGGWCGGGGVLRNIEFWLSLILNLLFNVLKRFMHLQPHSQTSHHFLSFFLPLNLIPEAQDKQKGFHLQKIPHIQLESHHSHRLPV